MIELAKLYFVAVLAGFALLWLLDAAGVIAWT